MKKSIITLIALIVLAVGIYFVIGLFYVKPPTPILTVEDKKVEGIQGSYCWDGLLYSVCADTSSPPEMIKNQDLKPIVVSSQSNLKIEYKNKPQENAVKVNQWLTNGNTKDVPINDNAIQLPKEKGVFVYDVSARWEKGSSSYAFVVEVK
ncbi:hypothetical protein [Fredinandcohnia quinoae]|uniref:Uncharacterized protein n=1 Tax=Fredinandcohnia quinoae TaxID=2918902 RepID=A0AAW5EED4_9BACI|nr:hypothetical protein [Fredinandcohnia sp. SECRCQ15]MCH1627114.1 hypothetical protein [Fredinandcohnia sp. SECRCQ15]